MEELTKTPKSETTKLFNLLKKVWNSRVISRKLQLRISNSNVKSVLWYGSETGRNTKSSHNKLQTFVNKCLRRILKISWTDRVTNEDLWKQVKKPFKYKSDEENGDGLISHTTSRQCYKTCSEMESPR